MKIPRIIVTAVVLSFLFIACKNAPDVQNAGSLPRSVPEAEGISSAAIMQFLDSAMASQHEFHSIMIVRHGKVIAEGWWNPYGPDLKHTLYSTSKSFTSTALGFAVAEKKLTVKDKVVSFFADELPDTISPYLAQLTLKDLLTMSVGQDPDPTFSLRSADSNWVRSFLALPIVNEPGTMFLYNSMATYMLSAIVQKVTGERIIDYLTPRLFEPLGISGMDWEVDPMGINTGGWGLRLKTEDMAKFGQLLLQKGKWNDRQIIPASWVEEATTFKIDQAPDAPQSRKDSSDWMQGYCYQFWRCRNNAFRADGAFGQYIIVMPDQDAVIAITAESPDMQDEINLIWENLLPAMEDKELPENVAMAENLRQRLQSLSLPPDPESIASNAAPDLQPKTFQLEDNDRQLDVLSIEFTGELCHVVLQAHNAAYRLDFGSAEWTEGTTARPGPSLTGPLGGIDNYRIAGKYNWRDNHTLYLVLRYIESPHHEKIICTFDKDNVTVSITPSTASGRYSTELKGVRSRE
jgi:CubicO group peptidase (beta-lactamase class C family)